MKYFKTMLLLAAVSAAGCVSAHAPPPKQAQISAVSAIRAADQLASEGSRQEVDRHLVRAKKDVRKGKVLAAQGAYTRANYYFERAEARAQVAQTIAQAERAEMRAQVAQAELAPEQSTEEQSTEEGHEIEVDIEEE